MDSLVPIFDFVADTIYQYLTMLNSHWYTQVLLYIVILSIVVSTIILLRGR